MDHDPRVKASSQTTKPYPKGIQLSSRFRTLDDMNMPNNLDIISGEQSLQCTCQRVIRVSVSLQNCSCPQSYYDEVTCHNFQTVSNKTEVLKVTVQQDQISCSSRSNFHTSTYRYITKRLAKRLP